jgi:hypothetical protein
MRRVPSLILILALAGITPSAVAGTIKETNPDPATISALAQKASAASPREQCFLYAEVVHQMTELAGRQLSSGQDASNTLRAVSDYARRIHMGLSDDTKRLKNAQILVEHTSFRLNEILHSAELEDRPVLESTLKQLNQVQTELMMQVFRR